jgi:hypothetical protein
MIASRIFDSNWIDRIFTNKASCKDAKRPQLEALMAFAREAFLGVFQIAGVLGSAITSS